MAKKKELRISFQTFEELDNMMNEKRFKIVARSALGVKHDDDGWIQQFNIGNLMHLTSVSFDDFNDRSVYKDLNEGLDKEFAGFV